MSKSSLTFKETALRGAFIIEPEPIMDERGFFSCTFSQTEFERRGLNGRIAENNLSFNKKRGTLRGMHYQAAPYGQAKLVHCTAGAIYDVIIDLRRSSPTFKHWAAIELSAANYRMLYIPEGMAHGFQTLADNSCVFYQMSEVFAPDYARGVRWNDPAFGIQWPPDERTIIARDLSYPNFD